MRLKLDENLGRRASELLKKAGYDVATGGRARTKRGHGPRLD